MFLKNLWDWLRKLERGIWRGMGKVERVGNNPTKQVVDIMCLGKAEDESKQDWVGIDSVPLFSLGFGTYLPLWFLLPSHVRLRKLG